MLNSKVLNSLYNLCVPPIAAVGRPELPVLPPGEEVLARVPEGDDLGKYGPQETVGSVT